MRVAPAVVLSESDREWMLKQSRSAVAPRRLGERCQVVLLAAEGKTNEEIAAELSITRQKAGRWRSRFVEKGRIGIEKDEPGRGRKLTYPVELREQLVRKTTQAKPADATQWSRTSMAEAMAVSPSTVGRIWKEHGLKPHLEQTFKVSNDPHFAEKLEDIVGLYLNAPEHAVVLCCDEKSQIQALDRTQPGLPLKKGRASTMTHDYVRHGTTTLFAALNVANGQVIGECHPRHRHQEWLKFLRLIDEQTPADRDLHLILDNYATHKHPKVKAWLAKHPRFHLHFTPTSASWLNMVERFFRDLTVKRLRRGVFHSLEELVAALETYLALHNHAPSPFIWTANVIRDR
ncbi:MAG: ISBmu8 transposase [Chthoniobacteraceae bacterium]|nr:ISBmu8 transposase [Chthoniobacteraceae bacterium]